MEKELVLFKETQKIMQWWRVDYRPATMVLYHMALTGSTYREALEVWAEYEFDGAWSPERWHSQICYRLLKAWVTEPAAQWFDCRAQEVRDNASRVHA